MLHIDDILIMAESLRRQLWTREGKIWGSYSNQEVCPRTHTEDEISGVHGGLNRTPTPSEAQEDPVRRQRSVGSPADYGKETVSVLRETDSSHQGNSLGPTILQRTPKSESGRLSPGLQ